MIRHEMLEKYADTLVMFERLRDTGYAHIIAKITLYQFEIEHELIDCMALGWPSAS